MNHPNGICGPRMEVRKVTVHQRCRNRCDKGRVVDQRGGGAVVLTCPDCDGEGYTERFIPILLSEFGVGIQMATRSER